MAKLPQGSRTSSKTLPKSGSESALESYSNSFLILEGARENNLKNITLKIPHNQLVAVTGVSGSGKSTLAFDTIYAEGARRYIETFSPYTRQFLDRLHQPDIDRIEGVRPALALEQKNRTTSSRSTVGTVTELNDYLKILWANVATFFCPRCDIPVHHETPRQIAAELIEEHRTGQWNTLLVAFPVKRGESSVESFVTTLQSEGFVRFATPANLQVRRLDDLIAEEQGGDVSGELLIVVDRIVLTREVREPSAENTPSPERTKQTSKLSQTLAQAYHFGHGEVVLLLETGEKGHYTSRRYYDRLACNECGTVYQALRPSSFTFNSPLGACGECSGFGRVLEIDPRKIIPDDERSIDKGAIACWASASRKAELKQLMEFCRKNDIPLAVPWRDFTAQQQQLVLNGKKGKGEYKGILGWFEKLKRKRRHLHVRVFLSHYRSEVLCPECKGGRLRKEALFYRLHGQSLREVWFTPIERLVPYFQQLESEVLGAESVEVAYRELMSRLLYLQQIGLGYLTLDRQSRTLSGGEHQRVNLTSLLGSNLVNTTLVLDEPTIALHARDTGKLLKALRDLRDRGNSVIVVEHEQDIIRAADHVIDLGPLSGAAGGEVVFQGAVKELWEADTLTGKYLSGRLKVSRKTRTFSEEAIQSGKYPAVEVRGARANNLKSVDVKFPLGGLVVVTGISGSGKSTLIHDVLFHEYEQRKHSIKGGTLELGADARAAVISGLEGIDEIVMVDQSPVGKTPRSNPGTYTKAWDYVRDALAETEDAVRLGLSKSAFSFNVTGGRCASCEGAGFQRIEMQFLADVFVECEACGGKRFKDEVLTVRLGGRNVEDLLNMTLDDFGAFLETLEGSKPAAKARELVRPLQTLGLGYLRVGQPLNEISGGEAQRIKLSAYLQAGEKRNCLFLLDEPTTGLHPHNIASLLRTFDELIGSGHTVVCIEHNLDVIANADWMIDLGPEGGEAGGYVMVVGDPRKLVKDKKAVAKSETLQSLVDVSSFDISNHNQQVPDSVPILNESIVVQGARENNLKDLSVEFPKNTITAVTGVSGSGKSTLAFDILFQEGQRRYIDCLSPYARQYITQVKRADVDRVDSIPPTIAISQKTAPPVGISTIATTTELYQYLRLLFSKVGEQRCPEHDTRIASLSPSDLTDAIIKQARGQRVFVFAPVVDSRKGYYTDLFERALRAEMDEARVDGRIVKIEPGMRLERQKLHTISLLVGSLSAQPKSKDLLEAAVRQALLLGSGTVEVAFGAKDSKPEIYSAERMCPICQRGFRELDPRDFSFRSERGMCMECGGRGVLYADDDDDTGETCSECNGSRLSEIGRHVSIDGRTIFELCKKTAPELRISLGALAFDPRHDPIVRPILQEVLHRLEVIEEVGLDYIILDRDASTLSGGEAQRLRLARTLGSPLSGVCYVLDEPTIGLHPQDHGMLMGILKRLRDRANTVIVVEHDEETIAQADHIIDIGPTGGRGGGHLVSSGSLSTLLSNERSITGRALRARFEESEREVHSHPRGAAKREKTGSEPQHCIILSGAERNNLRKVQAEFPLEKLTVVCGVSGSGKSSLVHGCLVPALIETLEGKRKRKGVKYWSDIQNADGILRLLEIDQTPVGRTSASTPASYLGIFDDIRKIFALLPDSRSRGWTASHFSFNSGKGRCPVCQGRGFTKIPMSFLPDATLTCEECGGARYTLPTLEVLFQGLSVSDILQKTMSEAKEIFANHSRVRRVLEYVDELGLGYLTLGQPTHTLSGGEAQRLKIARELGAREAVQTVYILDEPTIGLHMTDVDRLMNVIRRLIEKGNTVVVVEHNLDVLAAADHLIELGPGPGAAGGRIIYQGHPAGIRAKETPTGRAFQERLAAFSILIEQRLEKQTVKQRGSRRKSGAAASAGFGEESTEQGVWKVGNSSN